MIIKRKFKNNLCVFEDIAVGEVFRLEHNANVYMRVDGDSVRDNTAVNLETGHIHVMRGEQNCILIPKAKMSVTIDDNIECN